MDMEVVNAVDLDANAVRSQLLELARLEKLNNNKHANSSLLTPTIAIAPSTILANESVTTSSELSRAEQVNNELNHRSSMGNNENDDWIFARALQAMEFEISNEMIMVEGYEEGGDFNEKEYRASRSCRSQLLTLSAFICLVQIGVMITTIQMGGYASRAENPMLGPPA
jgi:hypothetical protein